MKKQNEGIGLWGQRNPMKSDSNTMSYFLKFNEQAVCKIICCKKSGVGHDLG
jgi:hypothetical protein